jgi:uncharacterized protein YdeI (YjbR/CyaY-like superfamily)
LPNCGYGRTIYIQGAKEMHVQSLTIPDDLRQPLEELGAIATVDEMPLDYRKRAFLFIERAGNAPTRDFRINNFLEVVKCFQHDSERGSDPDRLI